MNCSIREIACEIILLFHNHFSDGKLLKEFVPLLESEIESGWTLYNTSLLEQCGTVISFYIKRKLFSEEFVPHLKNYYEVINNFIKYRVL